MSRKRHHDHGTAKKVAISSAVAAVAGYVTGILTAPKSGKETRHDVAKAATKSFGDAEKELKKLHTELDKIIEEAKKQSSKVGDKTQKDLAKLLDKAKDVKEKAREVLSAIHEGDAEDKDLDKAIRDASAAIDHIRDYLKK